MKPLPGNDSGGTLPFEGSEEIAGIVASLIEKWDITTFVETGTQRGATALWASDRVDQVITVELDEVRYDESCDNLKGAGVLQLLGDSADALRRMTFNPNERVLFYLDAHSITGTPIISELASIGYLIERFYLMPVIAIHDIEVPGHPELGFDRYEDGTVLNIDLIKGAIFELGMEDWPVRYNSIPDGAARGFCYITPTE